MRLLLAGAGAVIALLVGAAVADAKFHATHSVTVSGSLVDDWTIDEPDDCGNVGGGSVTVGFAFKKPIEVDAHVDRYAGSEVNGDIGRWVFVRPQGPFHQITDIHGQASTTTITRVDNTVKRQRPPGEAPCEPSDKSGCGATQAKGGLTYLGGYDKKRVMVDLGVVAFSTRGAPECLIGQLDMFSSPPALAGGTSKGELVFKMPAASKLRRKKVVTVTGTSHKRTSYGSAGGTVTTDDVTRTVTVTFKRLK